LADLKEHTEASAAQVTPRPKLTRLVFLPEKVSVMYLAEVSGSSLYTMEILMKELHIFSEPFRSIDFADAAKILRTYGILAKRAA
jgi:hypothetical protein